MAFVINGYTLNGDRENFHIVVNDFATEKPTIGVMSRETLKDLIVYNIDKLVDFDLCIDNDVEYMNETGDDECVKQEMTD